MPHDPLQALLRVRRRAVEEGRRTLAISLDAASIAAEAVREAELAIIRETERATESGGGDNLVEAFAAWLPGARRRVAQALDWQDRQEAEVARCRADLTACRQALESLEQLCTSRRMRADEAAARQEAQRLDEAGSRPRPDPD
jgi:flagellar biosynthesis chaperone FliJ